MVVSLGRFRVRPNGLLELAGGRAEVSDFLIEPAQQIVDPRHISLQAIGSPQCGESPIQVLVIVAHTWSRGLFRLLNPGGAQVVAGFRRATVKLNGVFQFANCAIGVAMFRERYAEIGMGSR